MICSIFKMPSQGKVASFETKTSKAFTKVKAAESANDEASNLR